MINVSNFLSSYTVSEVKFGKQSNMKMAASSSQMSCMTSGSKRPFPENPRLMSGLFSFR